jgi:hypothetical protein
MRNALLVLFFITTPSLAFADQLWKEVEGWSILINEDDVSRCYAARTLDDGTLVQIGAMPTLDGGYFAIYNAAWTHIEDGAEGSVEFDFGRSRFGGAATGKIENGIPGGYVFFDNPAFVQEFARRRTVRIIGSNGTEFELDLKGTSRAIRAVLACQDAQPAAAQGD